MELEIRKAELNDCEYISLLSQELGYKQNDILETSNRLTVLLTSKNDEVWVALSNGDVVGWMHTFIAYRLESNFFIEIAGLVVSSKSRKIGIGKMLIEKASKLAIEHDCNLRVRCNSIREEAHAFYENIGFEKIKAQEVFEKRNG